MEDHPSKSTRFSFRGTQSGQIVVGDQNSTAYTHTPTPQPVTEADLQALRQAVAAARQQVDEATAQLKPEVATAATTKLDELEEALIGPAPDLTTMEYVRNWFLKHLPQVAGTISAVVIHPIVGQLVAAAGGSLTAEFQRRFGPNA